METAQINLQYKCTETPVHSNFLGCGQVKPALLSFQGTCFYT